MKLMENSIPEIEILEREKKIDLERKGGKRTKKTKPQALAWI